MYSLYLSKIFTQSKNNSSCLQSNNNSNNPQMIVDQRGSSTKRENKPRLQSLPGRVRNTKEKKASRPVQICHTLITMRSISNRASTNASLNPQLPKKIIVTTRVASLVSPDIKIDRVGTRAAAILKLTSKIEGMLTKKTTTRHNTNHGCRITGTTPLTTTFKTTLETFKTWTEQN